MSEIPSGQLYFGDTHPDRRVASNLSEHTEFQTCANDELPVPSTCLSTVVVSGATPAS